MPATARAIAQLYASLLDHYGPQGWWPLLRHPAATAFTADGYHPGTYDVPCTQDDRFEVACGAILTQHTAWTHAERALRCLLAETALAPEALLALRPATLAGLVRSAGHPSAKARALQNCARLFLTLGGQAPGRGALLGLWGIGPETADCIRLYAYHQPEVVLDAYTRRILAHLRLVPLTAEADAVRRLCHRALPDGVPARQEFHALMVAHGKRHYRRAPYRDPLVPCR